MRENNEWQPSEAAATPATKNNNKMIIRKRRRQKITHTRNKIRANGKKRTKLKDTEGEGRTRPTAAAAAAAATEKGKSRGTHAVHKFLRLWKKKKQNSCEVADEADNAVEAEIHTHTDTRTVEDTNKQKSRPRATSNNKNHESQNFTRQSSKYTFKIGSNKILIYLELVSGSGLFTTKVSIR